MLTQLSLSFFRNYDELDLNFSLPHSVFIAPNGTGKTNILESIALISTGSSWRVGAATPPLLKDQHEKALIKARYNNDVYALKLEKRSKKILKNEKQLTWKQHLGKIPTLLFAPELQTLFTGSRTTRLRYFDLLLCQLSPEYYLQLKTANRLIRQKKAELKNDNPNRLLLESYNALLSPLIPQIYGFRKDLTDKLLPLMAQRYSTISGEAPPLAFGLAIADWKIDQDPGKKLESLMPREIASRRCLMGPHLDDFVLFMRQKPLQMTASRGETRSMILSLISAIKTHMEQSGLPSPLLLLDDVFSELDETRQAHLADLCEGCQTFLTTTHKSHVGFWDKSKTQVIELKLPKT